LIKKEKEKEKEKEKNKRKKKKSHCHLFGRIRVSRFKQDSFNISNQWSTTK
jgi:hypothetical protein